MHMIASPASVDFGDMKDKSPPRIISVVRKSHGLCSQTNYRAKLTGKCNTIVIYICKKTFHSTVCIL